MNTLSLAFPKRKLPLPLADGAGIYRLRHLHDRKAYIGSSLRLISRYGFWRNAAQRDSWGNHSVKMANQISGTAAEDWLFEVLKRLDGATDAELARHEDQTIKDAISDGWHVLNARFYAYRHGRWRNGYTCRLERRRR